MKSRFLLRFFAAGLALSLTAAPAKSQEPRQVVDEVIAQVNDDIITLSKLRAETKRRIESLRKMGQTEQQATAEVTTHRKQMIAMLISDVLLVQKGKELGLSEEVEDQVKQRVAEVASHQDQPPTGQALEELRASLRTNLMKQAVFEHEVDSKLFFGFSLEELHAYFDAHKDKFRKPETVTLSEIFLSSAGKDEAQVRAKAERLVAQIRGGADFRKLAVANSEREIKNKPLAPTTGGTVGTFEVPTLREDIASVIRNIKVSEVSDPIRTNDGFQILRVDARTTPGSSPFNELRVREAMTIELSPQVHEEYLQSLREEAYIEIAKDYQDAVLPPR